MELIVGLLLGVGFGCLFALHDLRSTFRRKLLLSHLPQPPYLLLLYLALTTYAVITKTPDFFKVVVSGMIGVESVLLLVARRLR